MVRDLIEFIARALVEEPDRVRVREAGRRTLELEVADADLGRVIGRRGKTANAMRTVLNASVDGRGVNLEIVENRSG
jgi:predicted RNA-binding protein YlqC (UPF0109 family)